MRHGAPFFKWLPHIRAEYYHIKTFLDPFKDSATTLSATHVRLPKKFLTQKTTEQCELIIHEATHQIQHEKLKFGMWVAYAQKSGRIASEKEAYAASILWLAATGRIRHPASGDAVAYLKQNQPVANIVHWLMNDYYVDLDYGQTATWARNAVIDAFAKLA